VASKATAEAGGFAQPLPVWSIPSHSPLHGAMLESLETQQVSHRSISTCNNVRTLVDIIANGGGAAVLPATMIAAQLAEGSLIEVLPRPARTIQFEAAIRLRERDPVVIELFRRAQLLRIG